MKGKQIAKMFESIPNFDTYSHYNSILEKVFKSGSLKNFIETLKHQKSINEISLLDQISKIDTNKPIDIYADEDSELKKIQNEEENDIFDEISDEKDQYINKKNEKRKHELWRINAGENKKKKRIKLALDPFKYNPNYNSIYKNIPTFKIIDPNKVLSNMDDITKNKRKLKNKDRNKSNEKRTLITETNINLNKKYNNSISPLSENKKFLNTIGNSYRPNERNHLKLPKLTRLSKDKIVDTINSDNENHALRFSKYIPRKYHIYNNNKIVSYLNPINYIKPKNKNKSIDFDKMLHRSEKTLLYASCLKNPSFGQYNPKYTYIDKNEKVRLFNPEEKDFIKNKKYLMKKLWTSYNVNTEYQLVDNNKINN